MVAQVSEHLALPPPPSTHHWFSGTGVVVEDGDRRLVYVGGTLIGSFGPKERMKRNAILLGLLENDESVWIGKLCVAFGLSREGVRAMQKQLHAEGLAAVLARKPGGRGEGKTSAGRVRRLEAMFEAGLSIAEAQKKLGKIGRSTVGFLHKAWVDRGRAVVAAPAAELPRLERVASLPLLPESIETTRKDGSRYMLHEPRSRRSRAGDASSRGWMSGQRVGGCSCEGGGGGTSMSPISTASCAGGMRARVATQYLGASSR